MPSYVAIIEDGGPEQAIGVWFPDLPGCFSGGDDLDEAIRNAPEAIGLYADSLAEEGRRLPAPRSLSELRRDPAVSEDIKTYAVALIEAPDRISRTGNDLVTKAKLDVIRSILRETVVNVSSAGYIDSFIIATEARKRFPAEIEEAHTELETLALTKLIDQVIARNVTKVLSKEQISLFKGYEGIPFSIPVRGPDGSNVRRMLAKATVGEVRAWLTGSRLSRSRSRRYHDVVVLLRDISPFISSENDSIEKAIAAKVVVAKRA